MKPLKFNDKKWLSTKSFCYTFIFVTSIFFVAVTAKASDWEDLERGFQDIRYLQDVEIGEIEYGPIQTQHNASIIRQNGNNNSASIVQSNSTIYQNNLAHITQNGNNNQASIVQTNSGNIGVITQIGNEHSAAIVQGGNEVRTEFQANISQFGLGSDISLSQSGNGQRSISIVQQNYSGNALPVIIDTY